MQSHCTSTVLELTCVWKLEFTCGLQEKKRKVYAGWRGLWEALDRQWLGRLEGVQF